MGIFWENKENIIYGIGIILIMEGLDLKDWKILEQLCTDARASHNSIAKSVGLSKNAVTYRVDRLVKKGVISGFFTVFSLGPLNVNVYNVFIRLSGKEQELVGFLKNHPNTRIVDRLVGEWNFLVEFVSNLDVFYHFLDELKSRFAGVLDVFEVHPEFEAYKLEQLPVELVKERPPVVFKHMDNVEIDDVDVRLLFELNKNCTATLFELAGKLGVTYETVSARIKKLKEKGVILRFSAKINLGALGYDVYLVRFDLRNLSTERASALRGFVTAQRNVRYAFVSSYAPVLFLYLAVKKADELNSFLVGIKEKFADVIVNQKYLLSSEQLKYDFFPEGLLKQ